MTIVRSNIILQSFVYKQMIAKRSQAMLMPFSTLPSVKKQQLRQPETTSSTKQQTVPPFNKARFQQQQETKALQQQKPIVNNDSKMKCKSEQNPTTNSAPFVSPSELTFTGNATLPITSTLQLIKPFEGMPRGRWPVFRLMDENGEFRTGSTDGYKSETTMQNKLFDDNSTAVPNHTDDNTELDQFRNELKQLYPHLATEFDKNALLFPSKHNYPDTKSKNTLSRAYQQMIRLRQMDEILQNAQRQGRISFYMTCRGEEAIHFGAASALTLQDVILAQYREQGLLMWRGFTLEQFTDQCFSNESDLGKGRQMPVHYGSKALNFQTISSPLGTQIPQAAGAAYQMKLAGKDGVAICFFGEGCTSTSDFHVGLNFASTLQCPVVFFCRNNGYAISTSVKDQYAGDGVVSRAPGYGMAAIRVDGNDIFAVHAAVREAKAYALKTNSPVLIEAMTYRQGHHSTSDDSMRYRSAAEVEAYGKNSDPLSRLDAFVRKHDLSPDQSLTDIEDKEKLNVLEAMGQAERKPKPPLRSLFDDVYHTLPASLQAQQNHLKQHLKTFATNKH